MGVAKALRLARGLGSRARIVVTSKVDHGPPSEWFIGNVNHPALEKTPVVAKLWQLRFDGKPPSVAEFKKQTAVLTKTPRDSRVEAVYAFSTDKILVERYRNPFGAVRIGRLLEDLDALAGTVAYLHGDDHDPSTYPNVLVTASVDQIRQTRPISLEKDLLLFGSIGWVGNSSAVIRTSVFSADDDLDAQPVLDANFTYVARDPQTGKSSPMNKLQLNTPQQLSLSNRIQGERDMRKQRRNEVRSQLDMDQNSLATWWEARRARLEASNVQSEEGRSIPVEQTRHENIFLCQPQHENLHGRVFGGFLMRRAYELAFASAYQVSGARPVFRCIDEISFKLPVDVGDILRLESRVFHSCNSQRCLRIFVRASIEQPEIWRSQESHHFIFEFGFEGSQQLPTLVPSNEEDAKLMLGAQETTRRDKGTFPDSGLAG